MLKAKNIFLYVLLVLGLINCADALKEQEKNIARPSVSKRLSALPQNVKAPLNNPASV
ncbi:hypothetical protein [Maribacter antarcticus]|uniref:hypothetical protein n=1 Tax=Maribacter antarcticus TaxID=505250 RepID=UPI000AA96635|nr:hypothetical protein [Maribacter antarcticus]